MSLEAFVSKTRMKTINLYSSDVKRIERLVGSGYCASTREIVRRALDALENQIEDWLRKEILPVCEEYDAHPERAIPAEEVFASIRAHHEARLRRETKHRPHP